MSDLPPRKRLVSTVPRMSDYDFWSEDQEDGFVATQIPSGSQATFPLGARTSHDPVRATSNDAPDEGLASYSASPLVRALALQCDECRRKRTKVFLYEVWAN